jgi:alginate O-acetyltransferase complex protein AlgI
VHRWQDPPVLFTTAPFVFLYLPTVAIGFFALGRAPRAAAAWLGLASLFFYGYWVPVYLLLLIVSITTNYATGIAIGKLRDQRGAAGAKKSKQVLIAGLVFNLGVLSYFKYANFFLDTLRAVSDLSLPTADVILPIGISFFTFTQIAFLVDSYQKGTREYRFIHYLLFVTYFPHLVAGPVLHHAQMMPQFSDPAIYRASPSKIAAGLVLFALGLAKKIVVADGVAPYADSVFDAVATGSVPTTGEAWCGALAYTFQLYFDFSGYSDMAVGLSMIFGVKLPYNFASPYRATNISEFWRRWHMTLSAFLRDYLYIAMGGNRKGPARRHVNLMVTMLLGGLWHGAGWTFVVWGGLHGLYLVLHHTVGQRMAAALKQVLPTLAVTLLAWLLTMLAVVIAWVFFRAVNFESAGRILSAMFTEAAQLEFPKILFNAGLDPIRGAWIIAACALIAVLPANTNRMFERHLAACRSSESRAWFSIGGALMAVIALVVVNELRAGTSPFIYFNF